MCPIPMAKSMFPAHQSSSQRPGTVDALVGPKHVVPHTSFGF
jgi:hypothetical protein